MASRPRRIHLATGNAHKAREFQLLADASGLAVEFVPASPMPVVVEDAGTFVGNARKKAAALKAMLPPEAWVLADDSGLCVDALGGAPGVESAYFAGPAADGAANLRKLTAEMRDVQDENRGAQFVCVLVLLQGVGGAEQVIEGRCAGMLAQEPAGGQGFGYDPLFIPAGYSKTYAALGDEVKHKISHRGRAWRAMATLLITQGS